MFQAIEYLFDHVIYLLFGLICIFFGDFWEIWREIIFLKGLVKFTEMETLEDLMLF